MTIPLSSYQPGTIQHSKVDSDKQNNGRDCKGSHRSSVVSISVIFKGALRTAQIEKHIFASLDFMDNLKLLFN